MKYVAGCKMLLCRLQLHGTLNDLTDGWSVFRSCITHGLLKRNGCYCVEHGCDAENKQRAYSTKVQNGIVTPSFKQVAHLKLPPLVNFKRTYISIEVRKTITNFDFVRKNGVRCVPMLDSCNTQFHCSASNQLKKGGKETGVVLKERAFEEITDKTKDTFHAAIELFEKRGGQRRGHVEFIYAAMKYMQDFGVHRDLESYKKLMNIFPKGKMIPTNMFQVEFMHFPHQQQCAVDLLDQMEGYGVMPDIEMGDILRATFGKWGFPVRKYMRMMYWMPKFKHLSPFPLPTTLPLDAFELAKLAIARMCGVDLESTVSVFQAKDLVDSVDHTWIVSGQSPTQQELLHKISSSTPVFVEGVFCIYLKHHQISYFTLRADTVPVKRIQEDFDDVSQIPLHMFGMEEPRPADLIIPPSIHEQEDGTILAVCATGTSSRDSVLSWVRFLQETNPRLREIPVVFTLRSPVTGLIPAEESQAENQQPVPKYLSNFQFVDVPDDKKEEQK